MTKFVEKLMSCVTKSARRPVKTSYRRNVVLRVESLEERVVMTACLRLIPRKGNGSAVCWYSFLDAQPGRVPPQGRLSQPMPKLGS